MNRDARHPDKIQIRHQYEAQQHLQAPGSRTYEHGPQSTPVRLRSAAVDRDRKNGSTGTAGVGGSNQAAQANGQGPITPTTAPAASAPVVLHGDKRAMEQVTTNKKRAGGGN